MFKRRSQKDAGTQRSPLGAALAQLLASRITLLALFTLATCAMLALFAPWISPQNPYDLNAIDVRDSRLPPGSVKTTEITRLTFKARISGLKDKATTPRVALQAARSKDKPLLDHVDIALLPAGHSAARQFTLAIALANTAGNRLAPLQSVILDGWPKNSTLSNGKKDPFRMRWTLLPQQLENLTLHLPENNKDELSLRVIITGGERLPVMTYWLGTDDQGRDMLSAIFYGLRISLSVALTSVVIALTIGTLIGLCAAYFGGWFDTLLMRLVDLQLSFPTILVALILLALLGKGLGNVMLALVIVQWALYARTARAAALTERSKEYIEAARSLALPTPRIIIQHLLPNCLPSLIVIATLQIAGAITLEATLSFLGLGLPVTQPSLGLLIANGFEYLLSGYPWISVIPGFALLMTVVSINLVGDELRDILNPRLAE